MAFKNPPGRKYYGNPAGRSLIGTSSDYVGLHKTHAIKKSVQNMITYLGMIFSLAILVSNLFNKVLTSCGSPRTVL